MLSLKTPTAAAIAPISSPRPAPAISPDTSPPASRVMVAVRSTIGLQTRRRTITISRRAGGGHRDENRERDQEAEARGGIVGAEDLLGVVVEGVTNIDDGAKGDLGFGIEEVDIMFVFA